MIYLAHQVEGSITKTWKDLNEIREKAEEVIGHLILSVYVRYIICSRKSYSNLSPNVIRIDIIEQVSRGCLTG